MQIAISAFVGCFAAMVVLAEVNFKTKWVGYVAAFVLGALLCFLLAWLLGQVAAAFHHVPA